jgi:hypothetical protein
MTGGMVWDGFPNTGLVNAIASECLIETKDTELFAQDTDNRVGRLKWSVNETERIRMLIIYEKDRAVVVLIKSNVSLSDSVDNILGYYYEPTIPE